MANKYEIDGIKYPNKNLYDYHIQLSLNKLVESFELPSEKNSSGSKYRAKKCTINDIVFDSIIESKFYIHLLEECKLGNIKSFELQPKYELLTKYRRMKDNKGVRAVTYTADFLINTNDDKEIIIDVKGMQTDVFRLKRKMFECKYPNKVLILAKYTNKAWRDVDDNSKILFS